MLLTYPHAISIVFLCQDAMTLNSENGILTLTAPKLLNYPR